MYSILSIDDDTRWQNDLTEMIGRSFNVTPIINTDQLMLLFADMEKTRSNQVFDLILLDLYLKDEDEESIYGLNLINRIIEKFPYSPIVILTNSIEGNDHLDTLRSHAVSFLKKKDFKAPSLLKAKLLEIIQSQNHPNLRISALARAARSPIGTENILPIEKEPLIGSSIHINEIKRSISVAARNPTHSILLIGETGSGKGLIAKYIHFNTSSFEQRRFTEIPISYINHSFELDLFGSAFFGKDRTLGVLERFQNDTIFFDEISDWTPKQQSALKKILDSRKIRPLGGDDEILLNAQIIASTNQPINQLRLSELKDLNQSSVVRYEIFHRFDLRIFIPPIRERREDIPLFFQHFLQIADIERLYSLITEEVCDFLFNKYDWPGNVNEIKNLCEHFKRFISEYPDKRISIDVVPKEIRSNMAILYQSNITDEPKIYLSFHIQDNEYKENFVKHFGAKRQLRDRARIMEEKDILSGSNIRVEREKMINNSNVFVIFISIDLISSSIFEIESELIKTKENGTFLILPIIIRECFYNEVDLIKGLLPTFNYKNEDGEWKRIVDGLEKAITRKFEK